MYPSSSSTQCICNMVCETHAKKDKSTQSKCKIDWNSRQSIPYMSVLFFWIKKNAVMGVSDAFILDLGEIWTMKNETDRESINKNGVKCFFILVFVFYSVTWIDSHTDCVVYLWFSIVGSVGNLLFTASCKNGTRTRSASKLWFTGSRSQLGQI